MGGSLSDTLSSNIGVKQDYSLSPTLFYLCMDHLEHMVHGHANKEGITNVLIKNVVLLLLLSADDVVLFTHSIEDAQKMMEELKAFCTHSGVEVNKQKTKIMLVKRRQMEQPLIMYNETPLELVENFKYLGLEILPNHKCIDAQCASLRPEKEHTMHLKTSAILGTPNVGHSRSTSLIQ